MPDSTTLVAGELRNLEQDPGENIGGVEACWYVPVEDVLSVPDSDNPVVFDSVQLREGATWKQAVAVLNTLRYTEPSKSDRHGPYYQPKLVGTIAKQTAQLAAGVEPMPTHRYLVLYRDRNGQVWLTGSLDEPLDFLPSADTGTVTTRNEVNFTFDGKTTRMARAYFGTWLVSEHGLEGMQLQQGTAGSGTIELRNRNGALMAIVPAGKTVIIRSGFRVAYTIQ